MQLPVKRSVQIRPVERVARLQTDLATRLGDTAWSAMHVLGVHRWRDGFETDPERGMSRYRGSRCTICDSPWEGW